ncbi:right-handed parallel beta-helix repeat-containing protein [Methylobacterium dankookense]|uniref:Right handed beta helix domain-containing protein n=1 Tax=Methylobacterium dankookense TaxID=560405 RepID=A0A564G0Y6_9HYPH|nr:right-handed parallel beta-helix repeat-containing protein [Methylobacterium dankookense]GJD57429.1 hypothetical protein IFDJLNFL_3330 [Methylobacterium dankookense]VUF13907.1 hypothetical protein MTDSW087_03615 [Methylobacterium dankookense]
MHILRLVAAASAAAFIATPAPADQTLPQGRILEGATGCGDILFGALKFGRKDCATQKLILQPDAITGDASGASVTADGAETSRSEAARAADTINAKDYATFAGAVGKAQATGKPLRLPAGAYSHTSGGFLTVTADLIVEPGAVITCGSGNLGLNGSITAPPTQIFAPGCTPSLYGNSKVSWAYPEWWGARGDSNLTPGHGTDNAVPLQSAIDSGVAGLQLCGNCSYRYTTTLKAARMNFAMKGVDRTVTRLAFDDATGAADAIVIDGSTSTVGGITITNLDLFPLRPAKGSVAAATPVAGGLGYAVNEVITLAGGTCATQPRLKVTSVDAGAVTGVSVETPGACTKRPLQSASMTTVPANLQASTTGSGKGATFDLRMRGPAGVHIRDAYIIRLAHNFMGGANGWDGVFIEQAQTTSTGKIYISDNIIQNMGNNGVGIWGPNNEPAHFVGDVLVDSRNYIQHAGHAGVEARGNVGGVFVFDNEIYGNPWGIFWDGIVANGSNKIRANDIDSNHLGTFLKNYHASHLQQNWFASGGPVICTLCAGIVADGNAFVGKGTPGSAMSQLWLNGVSNWNGAGSMFNGVVAPVQIGSYGATPSRFLNFTGSTHANASGAFATLSGSSTTGLTVGVQMDDAAGPAISGAGSKLTILGTQDATNNVVTTHSAVLWGGSNVIYQDYSSAGGNGNAVNGYAATAFGQLNTVGGPFSFVRGANAGDDNLYGADCFASGTSSVTGGAMACEHVLRATSAGTGATRLTADGAAAGAANCINLPNGSHSQMEIRISGRDTTANGVFADWASTGVAALDRGANAAATIYSGSFATATAAQASGGAGRTAMAQVSADTVNGCLNVSVTAPNRNAWRWVATVRRLKMQ